jgi:GT2 family glycosyltransferase
MSATNGILAAPLNEQNGEEVSENGVEYVRGWEVGGSCDSTLSDCSLIIPTCRRSREVVALLQHLSCHAADGLPNEIIVVDGSADRETDTQLRLWMNGRSLPFRFKYVHSKPGLTHQKNVGVALSSGSFLYFLDDDTRPEAAYFREMRAVFNDDHEGVIAAVGGAITNEMDKPVSFRWRVRQALRLVQKKEPMRYDPSAISLPMALAKPFSGTKEVDIVPGGASCFRREVFATERFSSFFEGYSNGEDVEMSLRVGKRFRLLWCGSARLTHYHAPGGRPPGFTRGRMDVRNRRFIRTRFWPQAPVGSRLRFWADVLLLVVIDLSLFVRRPRKMYLICHAVGLSWATVESLFSRPTFVEPISWPQYVIRDCGQFTPEIAD